MPRKLSDRQINNIINDLRNGTHAREIYDIIKSKGGTGLDFRRLIVLASVNKHG